MLNLVIHKLNNRIFFKELNNVSAFVSCGTSSMLGKEADHSEIFYHFRQSVQDNSVDLMVLKTKYLAVKGTIK
jgi:hypothetical protein